MKKFLLTLFVLIVFCHLQSQVVFCPKGAEWSYIFTDYYPRPGYVNETIKYVGDSIIGTDTLKVLSHSKFFTQINFGGTAKTYIKQRGDTVFMKNNRTINKWQILYNYAALPGQSWTNTLVVGSISGSVTSTYTTLVTAASTTILNNQTLKVLSVSTSPGPGLLYSNISKITERIGSSVFLFNYFSKAASDGDYYAEFLCYKDNAFDIQFTDKLCNFSNMMGIDESALKENLVRIYPNPANDILNVEFKTESDEARFVITDVLGQLVLDKGVMKQDSRESGQLDVSELKKGIYFLKVFDKEKLIGIEKIIKE